MNGAYLICARQINEQRIERCLKVVSIVCCHCIIVVLFVCVCACVCIRYSNKQKLLNYVSGIASNFCREHTSQILSIVSKKKWDRGGRQHIWTIVGTDIFNVLAYHIIFFICHISTISSPCDSRELYFICLVFWFVTHSPKFQVRTIAIIHFLPVE